MQLLMKHVNSLEDAAEKLEKAYFKKDTESVEKIKKFILEVKSKIDGLLK